MMEKYIASVEKRRETYQIAWYFYDVGAKSFGISNQLIWIKSMINNNIKDGLVDGTLLSFLHRPKCDDTRVSVLEMSRLCAKSVRYFIYLQNTVEIVIRTVLDSVIGTSIHDPLVKELRQQGLDSGLLERVVLEGFRISKIIKNFDIIDKKPVNFFESLCHFIFGSDSATVLVNNIHMDPKSYENPAEFMLDRFISPESMLVPFDAGCPAKKLAVQLIKVFLYLLLKDYDYALSEEGFVLRIPNIVGSS
jgi:hypothetical protein